MKSSFHQYHNKYCSFKDTILVGKVHVRVPGSGKKACCMLMGGMVFELCHSVWYHNMGNELESLVCCDNVIMTVSRRR